MALGAYLSPGCKEDRISAQVTHRASVLQSPAQTGHYRTPVPDIVPWWDGKHQGMKRKLEKSEESFRQKPRSAPFSTSLVKSPISENFEKTLTSGKIEKESDQTICPTDKVVDSSATRVFLLGC